MWVPYALLSALFAALTAVFAKIGVENVSPNLATAIRTVVVLFVAWGIVVASGQVREISSISGRGLLFLVLSGIATGLSWIFYFRALHLGPVSQVAPFEKLSVVLTIILSVIFLHEQLAFKTVMATLLIVSGVAVLSLR